MQIIQRQNKKIAKELGYTPNLAARNLVSNSPTAIGVIVPSLASYTAYNEVLNQLSVLAAKENLCLLLGSSNRSIDLETCYCKMLCENMVGALIIASCSSDVSHIHDICDNIVPTIFIGGKTSDTEETIFCRIPTKVESWQLAIQTAWVTQRLVSFYTVQTTIPFSKSFTAIRML